MGPIIGPYQSFFDNFNLKSNNRNGVTPEYYYLTRRHGARTTSRTLVRAYVNDRFFIFIVSQIRRHNISVPLNRAPHRTTTRFSEQLILLRVSALFRNPRPFLDGFVGLGVVATLEGEGTDWAFARSSVW